jgi:hypothetical protein
MNAKEINFKRDMENKYIPTLERMLQEEIEHKKTLLQYYNKTKSRFLFNDTKSIKKILINSYCSIAHISHRLNQYKKFVQQ